MYLTEEQMNKIEDAIEAAELRTSGEIVPAIMDSSDHYPAAHFRSAILSAFFIAILLYLLIPTLSLLQMIWGQIAGLVIGYALAFLPAVKLLLLRPREIDEEVHQRALEVFFTQNIHQTEKRNGILIFVSRLERRIELIADKGIHDFVGDDFWKEIVAKMVSEMKQKNYSQAMIDGISLCADKLSVHFPADKNKINQLANKTLQGE